VSVDARRLAGIASFLLLVVGGGLAIGTLNRPDGWYAALSKPSFNPPNWVFAPVWTTLYVMIALAGWRVWRAPSSVSLRLLWSGQLILNFAWSPLFFGAHRIDLALIVIVPLLATILTFIALASRHDRIAALFFVPYAAWVAFATVLNASLLLLNGT
jgi:tryptophan-rich sensory protein